MHDERLEQIQGQAAKISLTALIVSYILLAIGYYFNNRLVPLETQSLFYLSFICFASFNLKHGGAHFNLPFISENDITLDQNSTIRSVPWLIVVASLISFIFQIVQIASIRRIWSITSPGPIFDLLLAIYFTLVPIAVAARVKHGDKLFIRIAQLAALIGILLPVHAYMLRNNIDYQSPIVSSPDTGFQLLAALWTFMVLSRYGRQMIKETSSYNHVVLSNPRADKMHRIGLALAIFIPITIFLLLILLAPVLTHFIK